jgi:hypothetical protein
MNQIYEQYSQDPDETFKMYVDRLMKAKPRFGGTFATPQQQGQDATSKATGGLLTGLFPEYADRMGGGGGDSGMAPSGGGFAPSYSNPRGNFASAEGVFRAQDIADFFAGPGQLARSAGPIGMLVAALGKKGSELYANNQWDSFNRGIDSDAAARAEAMGLGGMGTYSDRQGNLGTISNQALIDAYDREMFGTTGAEMNAERNGWSRSENESGGSVTDAGGGSFDYSADTGYDR